MLLLLLLPLLSFGQKVEVSAGVGYNTYSFGSAYQTLSNVNAKSGVCFYAQAAYIHPKHFDYGISYNLSSLVLFSQSVNAFADYKIRKSGVSIGINVGEIFSNRYQDGYENYNHTATMDYGLRIKYAHRLIGGFYVNTLFNPCIAHINEYAQDHGPLNIAYPNYNYPMGSGIMVYLPVTIGIAYRI